MDSIGKKQCKFERDDDENWEENDVSSESGESQSQRADGVDGKSKKAMLVRINTGKMESYLQNIKKQLKEHDARLREQASSTLEHHRGESLL